MHEWGKVFRICELNVFDYGLNVFEIYELKVLRSTSPVIEDEAVAIDVAEMPPSPTKTKTSTQSQHEDANELIENVHHFNHRSLTL